MLVLLETSAGFAIFKLVGSKWKEVETLDEECAQLHAFHKFKNTKEALEASNLLIEGKVHKKLKKFLKKNVEKNEKLIVIDKELKKTLEEKFQFSITSGKKYLQVIRFLKLQMENLITPQEQRAMQLGLAHAMSRYTLKFSADKVDTMIVQAINLLDDIDKELNNYAMRLKEWYSWHFPELANVIQDNIMYARVVNAIGVKEKCLEIDLSTVVMSEEIETQVKEASQVSMGTEISQLDQDNIQVLARQVIDLSDYRIQLYDYLKARMQAIAPNLTVLVGELVAARLIAHAGSLVSLSKHPASTIQILGAEKALFRAIRAKKDTPKYGLIYHASLVGNAPNQFKGRISRSLAAKCALSVRLDALTQKPTHEATLGLIHKQALEIRLKQLEKQPQGQRSFQQKRQFQKPIQHYSEASDFKKSQ